MLAPSVAAPAGAMPPAPASWVAHYSAAGAELRVDTGSTGCSVAHEGDRHALVAGTLYNAAALRMELGADAPPPGSSDAALVLRLYARWGAALLHRLKGRCTVLVHDLAQATLLCARDPLGFAPLFYADTADGLLLSPTIEALVARPDVSGALNHAALVELLANRWPAAEETCYAAVRRVPPGHALLVTGVGRRLFRYWDPAPAGVPVRWVAADEMERFVALFEQAVVRSLADGPAAIYLSGGLDSVSVAAIAARQARASGSGGPLALSLVFPDDECNEELVQRGVAKALGLEHVLLPFADAAGGTGLFAAALELSRQSPAPLQNVWSPAYDRLAAAAQARGCQVILTGGGGDEWLTVDPLYAADLVRQGEIGRLLWFMASLQRSYGLPPLAFARNLLWNNAVRPLLADTAQRRLARIAPAVRRGHILRVLEQDTPEWILPEQRRRRAHLEQIAARQAVPESGGVYQREMRATLDHPLLAMDLEESVVTGRRLGLRIAMPYWDADLVDLLYRMPPELLNRGGRSKGLVRQMVADEFPQLGFERQKKVLSLSFFQSLMLREGGAAWRQMGGVPALASLGIVNADRVAAAIEQIVGHGDAAQAHRLWDVLNLESWVRARL